MKDTTVIVSGSREAAREALRERANGNKIRRLDGCDEARLEDGSRILAMEGCTENICWLRDLGLHVEEIIVVKPVVGISEEMGKYINYVRSAIEWQGRQECNK